MPTLPPPVLLQWAAEQLNGDIERCTGLREGGGPWLLETRGPGPRRAVLRTAPTGSSQVETEALTWATQHHLPVPGLLAATTLVGRSAQLLEAVSGSSTIPQELPSDRLRTLGQVAARIGQVPAPPGLPERTRPIAGEDFAALRRQGPERALLTRAEEVLENYRFSGPVGFVHGDLWQGNILWSGNELTAVVDWDCAGWGHAGVDLGSLRCDAAICFGPDAAAEVLRGWETEAGTPARDVAAWDAVAALSTPPDMGWFPAAIADQGRTDLDQPTLLERRDNFLQTALDSISATAPTSSPVPRR